jgi:hypothetical protein
MGTTRFQDVSQSRPKALDRTYKGSTQTDLVNVARVKRWRPIVNRFDGPPAAFAMWTKSTERDTETIRKNERPRSVTWDHCGRPTAIDGMLVEINPASGFGCP